jgi:hypothetical protein
MILTAPGRSRQRLRGSERSSGLAREWSHLPLLHFLEDRLIRVINAVLVVVRPLRRPRAGQAREWVVVPARAPIVPRVVVRISLVVTGVEHAVAVDVPVVVVVALPEGSSGRTPRTMTVPPVTGVLMRALKVPETLPANHSVVAFEGTGICGQHCPDHPSP